MSKEVLKIALEALEPLEFVGKRMDGGNPKIDEAISAIKKALKQPSWVGLTDEDMDFLFPHGKSVWVQETVKIIEAKLKQKNEQQTE
jgi:hypothetical protein